MLAVVYAAIFVLDGKVNNIKVSLPPFIHSGDTLSKVLIDLIVGFSPVLILSFILNVNNAIVFLVILAAFILSGIIFRILVYGEILLDEHILKYVFWGEILTLLVAPKVELVGLVFAVVGANIIGEAVRGAMERVNFPAFITAGIFLTSTYGWQETSLNGYFTVPVLFCCIYLLVKRRISYYTLSGIMIFVLWNLVSVSSINVEELLSAGILLCVLMAYPGFSPGGNKMRLFFGFIAGVSICFFGIWGFFLLLMLSDFLDRI